MPVKSNKPFVETMQHLLEMEGISQRELTKRAQAKGWKRQHSVMHSMLTGQSAILPEHMEMIARVLFIEPQTFAEYRMWEQRRRFDPEVIGFKKALQNLSTVERAEGLEADPPQHEPSEVARSLESDPGNDEAGGASA